jgi:hypothetical protein
VDRFTAEASPETFDLPNSDEEVKEIDILIKRKVSLWSERCGQD